ncbi:MAG: F0F1 ATP synthase subunit delta [Salibacteraceae bacterium]
MSAETRHQRYAQALLDLASELGQTDKVIDDMRLIAATVNSSKELQAMLASPIIKPDLKKKVLTAVFEKHLCELSIKFIKLLTDKGREPDLGGIAQSCIALYNQMAGIIEAEVVTAIPLGDNERNELIRLLQPLANTIQLNESVDKSIIGGLKVKVGDLRVDATIKRKLNDLKHQIVNQPINVTQ